MQAIIIDIDDCLISEDGRKNEFLLENISKWIEGGKYEIVFLTGRLYYMKHLTEGEVTRLVPNASFQRNSKCSLILRDSSDELVSQFKKRIVSGLLKTYEIVAAFDDLEPVCREYRKLRIPTYRVTM